MKKTFSFILFLPFAYSFNFAQSCLAGETWFYTQEQIDNFPSDYPDCTEILGYIFIDDSLDESFEDPIMNLDSFASIASIGRTLTIQNNDSLISIEGLRNLTSVDINLVINNNASLATLNGLDSLASIGGSINLRDNLVLQNIDPLNHLSSLNGITITGNPVLENLDGFINVTSMNGGLRLVDNASLESIEGLINLTSIEGGSLNIQANPLLESLSGLDNIDYTTILFQPNIFNSQSLSFCAVQSLCDYLENGGIASISLNAPGCNSVEEVLADCNGTLPVEFLRFQVSEISNQIHLVWETLSERENVGFEIQTLNEQRIWQPLAFIPAAEIEEDVHSYEFIHSDPKTGDNFYRIKQEDYDGSFHYSPIRSIHLYSKEIKIRPNPARDKIEFSLRENVRGKGSIKDIYGNEVKVFSLEENSLSIHDLSKGIYFLTIRDIRNNFYTDKFVKL